MKIALTHILEHNGYTLGWNNGVRRKTFRERLAEVPKSVFIEAVKSSQSYPEIYKKIGVSVISKDGKESIMNHNAVSCIRDRCESLGITIDHIKVKKRASQKGRTRICSGMTADEVILNYFSGEDTHNISWATRRSLINTYNLLPNNCSACGIHAKWNGSPLTLHIDHINGDRSDNRLDNLRKLCPNCHTQTHTYGAKNRKVLQFED